MSADTPLIFDIRRFALDDGPGIRTTVFFKGCPLSCSWCHNPEAFSRHGEMSFAPERCIRCGACKAVCRGGARPDSWQGIDRARCSACGRCTDVCPSLAVKRVGEYYAANALVEMLMLDGDLYGSSGGGVTFSGGEPTLHTGYLREILCALKGRGIHTAIQTSGCFSYERFVDDLLPWLDLIYYDVKLLNRSLHEQHTGVDNDLILENLKKLTVAERKKIVPRIPLVPGVTATTENLLAIAAFLGNLGYRKVVLLPFNRSGGVKRSTLGHAAEPFPDTALPIDEEQRLKDLFYRTLSATGVPGIQAGG